MEATPLRPFPRVGATIAVEVVDLLDPQECREAVRALRGRLLREEVYGLDGSELEGVPYTVSQANAEVRRVQARGENKHAVFFVHDREALSYSYDRVAGDPRVSHALVLEVDAYGNVTRQLSVGYPRRVVPVGLPEQGRRTVVLGEASFAVIDDPVGAADVLRIGVPTGARSYEVMGLAEGAPIGVDAARAGLIGAVIEAPEFASPVADGLVHLRLLGAERTLYYAEDLGGALPWGACGTRALPFGLQAAAFSDGQVAAVYGAEVDAALLGEAGYVRDDGLWWARSMRQVFDATRFFAPIEVHDAFGNPPTRIAYDDSVLFATSVTDAMGNVVSAEHDYRVLAPRVVIDANGSRGGVVFDGRGMVVATYVAGRPGSGLGDTPEDPTSTMDYDLFAWRDRGEPNVVRTRTRERHGDPTTRWLEQWVYSDGAGHEILRKGSAEPGDAPLRGQDGALVLGPDGAPVVGPADPRYVGSGRTVFDNKGQVVKQYEPYFSRTPGYEAEVELREHGVTAIVHYDVVGRVVRTELPNGTFSRTEHGAWVQRAWDPNDTVLDSEWFAARAGGGMGSAEQRAAVLTAAHADTPTAVHVDALGRTCLVEEHAGFVGDPAVAVLHATRLRLDAVGNVLAVTDARGNTAEARVFGMLGQVLRTDSEDAGWRVGLADVGGGVVRSWNARGFRTRVHYDSLRRVTHQFVTPPGGGEIVVARTVYGEQVAEPARTDANLRGRVFRVYDGAGVTTNAAYDFEGNLVAQERRLAVAFATTQDWSVLDGAVPPSAEGIAALAEAELEAEVFPTVSEYDALRRVTSSTTPDGSLTLSTYNAAGLLEGVAVRIRGAATATTFVSGFDYDAKGQRLRCVHGNGTVTSYEYDPRTFRLARLRLVRDADSAVLQDLQYTYDPVGNITEIRDGAQQAVYFANAVVSADQRFEYDALYRLVRAEGREHASIGQPTDADFSFGPQPHPDDPAALRRYEQEYAWDEVGNLAQLRHAAGSGSFTRRYVYAAAGNRLLANSAPGEAALPFSHSYTYDEHGNMTSMPHLAAIAWDHADRMQHCDLGGGGDVWFVYDSAGERVRKVQVNASGSTVRERVYLGGYEVYRERAANSAAPDVERQTLHVGDDRGKLALVETLTVDGGDPVGVPSWIQRHEHGNHLGSASLELDEDAALISYEEFHPFGTTSYAANDSGIEVSAKRYRYIGKERDEETGLYHLGARYYASWLGRWTAADPIGLGAGMNRLAYSDGRPTNLVDRSGLAPQPPGAGLESRADKVRLRDVRKSLEKETGQRLSSFERRSLRVAARRDNLELARRVIATSAAPISQAEIRAATVTPADIGTLHGRQVLDANARSIREFTPVPSVQVGVDATTGEQVMRGAQTGSEIFDTGRSVAIAVVSREADFTKVEGVYRTFDGSIVRGGDPASKMAPDVLLAHENLHPETLRRGSALLSRDYAIQKDLGVDLRELLDSANNRLWDGPTGLHSVLNDAKASRGERRARKFMSNLEKAPQRDPTQSSRLDERVRRSLIWEAARHGRH